LNSWKIVDISRFFNDDDANGNETIPKENQSNDVSDEQTARQISLFPCFAALVKADGKNGNVCGIK